MVGANRISQVFSEEYSNENDKDAPGMVAPQLLWEWAGHSLVSVWAPHLGWIGIEMTASHILKIKWRPPCDSIFSWPKCPSHPHLSANVDIFPFRSVWNHTPLPTEADLTSLSRPINRNDWRSFCVESDAYLFNPLSLVVNQHLIK